MHQHQRSGWFGCACCISNMTRFLPSVPGYVYANSANDLYVNLFMANSADIKLTNGDVHITQATEYPWAGKVKMTIDPKKATAFALHIRIPGWAVNAPVPGDLYTYIGNAKKEFKLLLNGKPITYKMLKGYAVIDRKWAKGDQLSLELPMEIEKVIAHAKVKDDLGRFAFQRGPIVYCLEGQDNKDGLVQNIMVSQNASATASLNKVKLNEIEEIWVEGTGTKRQLGSDELLQVKQKVDLSNRLNRRKKIKNLSSQLKA